jgi:uncharacterized protein YbjT (DUF2867 family)
MSQFRFLITGATGATGGAAAAQLLEKGRQVRVFVHREDERSEDLRKRGAEVVVVNPLSRMRSPAMATSTPRRRTPM